MTLKCINHTYKFDTIIGTGGIGSGIFFSLVGNHNLGREESRLAKLEPFKDYCKQHIILHYLSVLLVSNDTHFKIYPIGKVGNDEIGKQLISMMKNVGMDTSFVTFSKQNSTLFSVCFQYPDGSGGNITTTNGASGEVSPKDISAFYNTTNLNNTNKSIVLAVPEVPLDTRLEILKIGNSKGSTTVASILSSEIDEFKDKGGFELTNILAINIDEAKSIANIEETASNIKIINAALKIITESNKNIIILITNGSKGSYCYKDNLIQHTPIFPVANISSTAGAGDAFLSGFLAGICCGLPIHKKNNDNFFAETPLETAVELGTILAGLSVGCSNTIHLDINAEKLKSCCFKNKFKMAPKFLNIFN